MILCCNRPVILKDIVLSERAFKRGDRIFCLHETLQDRPGVVLGAGFAKGSLAIQFDGVIESVFASWLTYPQEPEHWSLAQLSYYWKELIPQLGQNWLRRVRLRDVMLGEWLRARDAVNVLPSPPERSGGVYITDHHAFTKLQGLEGQHFINKYYDDFAPILRHLTERRDLTNLHGMTIYGRAMQHRYTVYSDGEIRFNHASGPNSAKKASKLGFRLD